MDSDRAADDLRPALPAEPGSDEEEQEDASFLILLSLSGYRYEGVEAIDGILCHRIAFDPSTEPKGGSAAEKVAETLKGHLWVTVEGSHLYRAEAESKRYVSFFISLAKLTAVKIDYRSQQVADDIWLPHMIEVETEGRIVFDNVHKRNVYTYSRYRPAGQLP